jgi:hypothetical protein
LPRVRKLSPRQRVRADLIESEGEH